MKKEEMKYYLAIDIGASSGRHVIGYIQNGRLNTEEIYRFPNAMIEKDGSLCWDTEMLFTEILNGLKVCRKLDKIPCSMSIDTWGVDYVLLDKDDNILGKTYGYRDGRTIGIDTVVEDKVSQKELFKKTGIQKQIYNTIYQMMAAKVNEPEIFKEAKYMLTMPCYLMFLLTGEKANEYTHASTTQMVNSKDKDWDYEIIKKMGFPKDIFCEIKKPEYKLGNLKESVQREVGFSSTVILSPAHDTACAVMALPEVKEDTVYISSGTWSLLGIESQAPILSDEAMRAGFTNEGGYAGRYRFIKNIMGLWMIQCIYHEYDKKYSYEQIAKMAESANINTLVDCEDQRFFAPKSMCNAIKEYAVESFQQVPNELGEFAAVIYNSLANCYKNSIEQIEELTVRKFNKISVIGGGSKAEYLNKVTAEISGKMVEAGLAEATAMGNIMCQMIADGVFSDLEKSRKCIKESIDVKVYGGSK